MSSNLARVFISSTFRDFTEERDLLVKRVFPALRAKLRERLVDLVDVDLRWGITAEQSERGEVLPICLAEIDRSRPDLSDGQALDRPWFVCMLGDRYGWVPLADHYDPALIERRPWLTQHQGGKSVTELEILHGVLNNRAMVGRAFFFFRAPSYAQAKGGYYVSSDPVDIYRLTALKDHIRQSGLPVMEDYPDPAAMATRLEADLWQALDAAFPADELPDDFTLEQRRHEAYAAPRRRLYLGGEHYQQDIEAALADGTQRVLISGQSGGGKSALLANWLAHHAAAHAEQHVHANYLGASSDATDPVHLVRHLLEHIRRVNQTEEAIADDPQALLDSLPTWLAYAAAHAGLNNSRWVIVLDGLNNLASLRDLRWLPAFLPERVHLVVSCLPGEVETALRSKGDWHEIAVTPLDASASQRLLREYLGAYNKTLPPALEARALAHPLAQVPIFLITLAEELRLFGSHETLAERLDACLDSRTVDDLFERVLARLEEDCGKRAVREVMTTLWASRAGLSEQEIQAITGLSPFAWASIRYGLDSALLESGGRISFAHDYLRIAVSDRYLAGNGELADSSQNPLAITRRRRAHARLARWFDDRQNADEAGDLKEGDYTVTAERAAEEIPWQWQATKNWKQLKAVLTRREMFEAMMKHRDQYELLGYWLQIEAQQAGRMERAYQRTWTRWGMDVEAEETGNLADAMSQLLRKSGRILGGLARFLAEIALAIAEKAKGPEHPDTGTRLNNLAVLSEAQGDYATAEPLLRRALMIVEKALGPEHPDTGSVLSNMAGLLNAQGDYAAAEPLYRRALAIAEKAQGPEHPSTGIRLNNLAWLLREQGDYAAAEPLNRRALAIAEKAQGPEHPNTGIHLNNLALLFKVQGDYAAAEPLLRRALAIAENAEGPEHPSTGTSLNNLAELLREQGDYAAAEPLYWRALMIVEKAQGPEHPDTGSVLNNLALLLQKQGDLGAAEPLYRRALAIAEKAQGPEHPDTGRSLNNLATLLQTQGNFAAAEPLYQRALAIAEKALGPEHPDTGTRLNNLAQLLQTRGNFAAAEPLYRRALAIIENIYGPDDTGLINLLRLLGIVLRESGNYIEADFYLNRAMNLTNKVHGVTSQKTASALSALGRSFYLQVRFPEAEETLKQAVAIETEIYGAGDERGESTRQRLRDLYNDLGRDEEAANVV
jgi:tetratricopeptide (TPR) repeat protein